MWDRVFEVLDDDKLLEMLAAIEHDRWAHWQRYVHSKCEPGPDGSLIIPAELADRWGAQIATPYSQLSEPEKESDREQVQRYLPVIIAALEKLREDEP